MSFQQKDFPLAQVFRIARGAKTKAQVIEVTLEENGCVGHAESVPYARYQESIATVTSQLDYVQGKLAQGISLDNVLASMAAGSAKNAIDCAYWDLKAKLRKKPVHQLLGLSQVQRCTTAQTLSIDTPENMAKAAKNLSFPPLIKVKLDNESILEKMQAIYDASPNSQFIVDANEGWSIVDLIECVPKLAELNVVLIEQPLPTGQDQALIDYDFPVALCADESCHTRRELAYLKGRYDAINIKLDKTGGLTEALLLAREATALGFDLMVGCMVGTSLAMAPAYLLAGQAKYVDLDGPLLVDQDRPFGFDIKNGEMPALDFRLWGGTSSDAY